MSNFKYLIIIRNCRRMMQNILNFLINSKLIKECIITNKFGATSNANKIKRI